MAEQGPSSEQDRFEEAFRRESCMSLETHRRSGKAVQTPVWFVESSGSLMFRTYSDSGKVKRLRADKHARVAPCTVSGKAKGDWFPVKAVPANEGERREAERLLHNKYVLQKMVVDLLARLRGKRYVYFVLHPVRGAPQ